MKRIGNRISRRVSKFESLESRNLLAGDLMISEFMARNSTTLADEDGDFSDWIEIYNPTTSDVDLSDWHLTDNSASQDKWSFPNQILSAGNILTVFASSKDRTTAGQQLHTNFKLDGDGEYLALSKNDESSPTGLTIVSEFDIQFPNRGSDVSFGFGQSVTVDSLIEKGDNARLFFPTNGSLGTTWTQVGFNDNSWLAGTNAIGYEQSVPGFTVHDAHSTGQIVNLSQAEAVLNGSGLSSEDTKITPVVNFWDPGGGGGTGNFGNTSLFPNDRGGNDDDFGVRATGTVTIPSSGTWTFGTNSDDGVRVRIDGQNVINDNTLHAPQNRFGQINLSAGSHSIELVFFERGGGAEVELFAAKGSYSLFNANAFRLVGDVANGGLVVETIPGSDSVSTGYSGIIETDTLAQMYNASSGVYLRKSFFAFNSQDLDSLSLRMRYDDGFIAYLNGTEVARKNAPASAQYNSTALTDRPDDDGLLIEDFDITDHLGLLTNNNINVLAIHAMNDAVNSDEFLNIAELAEVTVNDSAPVYFTTPTPGAFNSETGVDGFLIDEIQYSHPHGFYDNSFSLQIDTETDGTTVRYTLDGTEPTATHGTVYNGPINVNSTTTIRAQAFKDGRDPSNIATASFFFIDDVLTQSSNGSPPPGFPNGTNINGQSLDYGMDPAIVNSGTWGPQMEAALKQVPSMSIVMDIDDLLGSSNGIYTHAGNHGKAWERPISLELINPNGGDDFTSNAGLRIRGGFSRSGSNPKHAFRLFFRDEYGNGELEYPLFGDEGVDRFDKFDLRTTQNYSWAFGGDSRNAFVRDVFSRDLQGLMGHEYTRSRYYHLYINGQYWGLFQTQERSEARFAASYMGGNPEDYDVVKSAGSSGGYENEATDGNLAAYQRLADYFYQSDGLSNSKMNDYWKAQGMNPDGTRNPNFERLLDVDNIIDYMILTYYTSDADGPGSKFTRPRVNNYFGIFNRENPNGFKFFEHDSEHSLDTGNAAGANFDMVNPLTTGGSQFRYFNPHWMHERLAETNSEYRARFADRVYEVFFNDGLLTAKNAKALVDSRAAEFDMAIIAESARWGDAKNSTPYTKNNWQNAVNSVKNFIDNRIPTVLNQIKGQDWYPDTNPPQFTVNGVLQNTGRIEPNDQIAMFGTSSTNFSTIVDSGSSWKYLDNGSNQGTAWRATNFNDNSWSSGNAELGYGDGPEATVVSYGPNSGNKYRTTYFRKSFNVTNKSQYQALQVRLRRDDGAIVYLNGQEIVRSNMPAGNVNFNDFAAGVVGGGEETTFFEFEIDPSALNNGNNVLAVEIHQANAGSSDISFDLELRGALLNAADGNVYYTINDDDPRDVGGGINPNAILYDGTPFTLNTTAVIRARVFDNNEWSPVSKATLLVDIPAAAGNLAFTEVNYNPHDALTQFGDLDLDNDQFEFVELKNIGTDRIDLSGVELVLADNNGSDEGISFEFAVQTLDAGEKITVVRNRAAFVSRYGNSVRIAEQLGVPEGTGVFDGGLSNSGELLTLKDANADMIQQFEFNDAGGWPGRADGNGSSLEVIDPAGDYNSPSNWRSSNEFGGSPGGDGTGPINSVVINEILTHTDVPQIDAVELHNPTNSPVSIGSWYISDNNSNYFEYQFSILEPAIPAGGYRVVDENALGYGFKGQSSDDAWLIAADLGGRPLRFADHVEFSAAQNGVSFGRWPNSDGPLFPMTTVSLGAQNTGPAVGAATIAEVHFSPKTPDPGSGLTTDDVEFVEVWNHGGSPIDISHWRLNKAIDFVFPSGTTLAANGRTTIVSFDPVADATKAADFRTFFNMNAGAELIGPFDGKLDNGGEKLELDRPEDIAQQGLGYVLVDRVTYDDAVPWPLAAAGQGSSLNRVAATAFGNFASSWAAAAPSPGTVTVVANQAPKANDDSFSLNEGATLQVNPAGVLGNDTDADGDTLTASVLESTQHGVLALNANGSFDYVHDGSETTNDSFTYTVNDGNNGQDTATVSIVIQPINDPPVANGDFFAINEGQTLVISVPGVIGNDEDVDSGQLSVSLLSGPNNGTLTLSPNGSFTYVHDGGEASQDSFRYELRDGSGGIDSGLVDISINPVNDSPLTQPDSYALAEGAELTVGGPGVLANDSDPDEDNLTAILQSEPNHGTIVFHENGSFTYQHDGGETTSDSFVYEAQDGNGGRKVETVTLQISPVNDPPSAVADAYTVLEGGILNVAAPGLLLNDSDVDSGQLTAALVTDASHGRLSIKSDGSFTYQHANDGSASDEFTYRTFDGDGAATVATVTIEIMKVQVEGDFDGNGSVNQTDIELLCQEIRIGSNHSDFDLDDDGEVDLADFDYVIQTVLGTTAGDSNLDGRFNSTDLIRVFQAGEYQDEVIGNSTWSDGDWNCDGEFDSSDLIAAFQTGAYASAARSNSDVAAAVMTDSTVDVGIISEGPIDELPFAGPMGLQHIDRDLLVRDLIFERFEGESELNASSEFEVSDPLL